MNQDVFVIVVSMINSRQVRAWLGFSFERCVQHKIAPCPLAPLPPDSLFMRKLRHLYPRRLSPVATIDTFDRPNKTIVSIGYLDDDELIDLHILNEVNIYKDKDEQDLYIWTYNERRSYLMHRFTRHLTVIAPDYGTRVYKVSENQ